MTSKISPRILLGLSVVYGIVIALLAYFDVSSMTTIAFVGALVIGGLWAMQGFFTSRDRAHRSRERANRTSRD